MHCVQRYLFAFPRIFRSKSSDTALFFVSFIQMFYNTDAIDYFFMGLGTIGSLIVGISFPTLDLLFGRLLNSLNEPSGFVDKINQLCLYLVFIAIANILGGFLQVFNCAKFL